MKNYILAVLLFVVLVALLITRHIVTGHHVPRSSDDVQAPRKIDSQLVSIGTGGMTGVYFKVGNALMAILNEREADYHLKVSFQATNGSVYNINAVLNGDLDIGVCQADRQYQAYRGEGEWQDMGPRTKLRSICSLYPEAVTLVASADSGILTVADLKGKRVNVGNPGSGNRGNALTILNAAGLDWKRDLNAEGIKAAESAKLLQDGRLDAFFYTVGHPAAAISEAVAGRRHVRFVPITGMQTLLTDCPYYAKTSIPIAHYPQAANTEDVPTLGMQTTLIASSDTPVELVYRLTKGMFENIEEFRGMHPAFANLKPAQMVEDGLSAPLHPGSERYYREAGLINN